MVHRGTPHDRSEVYSIGLAVWRPLANTKKLTAVRLATDKDYLSGIDIQLTRRRVLCAYEGRD